jgi:hypothetical protein
MTIFDQIIFVHVDFRSNELSINKTFDQTAFDHLDLTNLFSIIWYGMEWSHFNVSCLQLRKPGRILAKKFELFVSNLLALR